jgi:CRISPR/Cas system CSM-associated protein Csm3 (group 7 of RAMP superfamily)
MENTVPRFVDKNTNPRRIQRVPAGTKFVGVFIIVGDDDKDMENKFELFKK